MDLKLTVNSAFDQIFLATQRLFQQTQKNRGLRRSRFRERRDAAMFEMEPRMKRGLNTEKEGGEDGAQQELRPTGRARIESGIREGERPRESLTSPGR